MLPLVKILWAWDRERKQRREKGHFWVAMLPTCLSLSLWLSFHLPLLILFFLLSFNLTFPLHLLTVSFTQRHTQTLSLSRSKDACRTPRWFTYTPAIIWEMCVCAWPRVCVRRGEYERKTAIIHLEEIISHRNQSYCLLKPHTHTFTQSFICPANVKWVYHHVRLSFFTAAVFSSSWV